MIGSVTSRNGESSTLSGIGIPRRSHSACSARVSSGSTLTVTASSVEGRIARAYATARIVGLWIFETSTIAWVRDGSTMSSSSSTTSSRDTPS